MFHSLSPHARGLLLAALGGLVLTIDIPLVKLGHANSWSALLIRTSTTLVSTLVIWSILRGIGMKLPPLIPGRIGLIVAGLYSLSSMTFLLAVFHTTTADLVFILAFNTAFAAVLSWIFLKERPKPATLAAIFLMIVGVLIIVHAGIGTGNLVGNALAMCSAFLIATAITISRWSGRDMGFASLMAVIPALCIAIIMVARVGFEAEAPQWIMLDGFVVIPIAFFCLANAPKYLSGPEVAMFYLLETVLAPIWVWLIFTEVPTTASLVGGAILIVTLIAHSAWQIAQGRRRRASLALRHPT
ncbi:DMT family transporter [Tianweitania populi]|uniref:Membrane protein n=1 Tax=Tianweitania populi TaxID=1607949 RepID=A0A8J3DUL8_9HYPH|nr:DMT family transporter [Tianweitania populi]GHD07302.1 membrane protein [Tianweitania populi]